MAIQRHATLSGSEWNSTRSRNELQRTIIFLVWLEKTKPFKGELPSLSRETASWSILVADEKLTVECHIGGAPAVTLAFLIEDYILHMQHHLDHVLGREVSTSYPGAAMGV